MAANPSSAHAHPDVATSDFPIAPPIDADIKKLDPSTVEVLNDLNLYEEDGATLITLLIEYPDKDTRDMILATGMADGMEASYARLERVVLDA